MTSNTDKLRAVFLTALMIGSVFAAGVAFTGSTVADVEDGSLATASGDTTFASSDTVTITGAANNSSSISLLLTDSEGNEKYLNGTTSAGANNESFSTNVGLSSGFDGSDAADGDLTVEADENSTFQVAQDSLTLTVESESPSVRKATHYLNASSDPILEVAFSADVSSTSSSEIVLLDADGDTLNSFAQGDLSDDDGDARITVDTGSSINNNVAEVEVNNFTNLVGDEVEDSTVSVTIAPQTIDTTAPEDVEAYAGTNVALKGNFSDKFDIEGPSVSRTRGAGTGSQVYVFNTDNLDTGDYNITTNTQSSISTLTLENLGLEASADAGSFDTNTNVTATATANDVERSVEAVLIDSNGDATDYIATSEIGSDGDVTLDFGQVAAADVGNYTAQVTDVASGVTADTDEFAVNQASDTDTEFVNVERTPRGDIASINVSLTETTEANLTIGTESAGYVANFTAIDGDEDGYVEINVNTYTMGDNRDNAGEAYYASGDEDSIESVDLSSGSSLDNPIASGTYRTTVKASGTDNTDDVSRLAITEADGFTNQNIWTAPRGDSLSDFPSDATLTQDDSITQGDWVVHEISGEGVFGILQNASNNGDITDTQALLNAANQSELSLAVEQTEDSTQQNRNAKVLNYTQALQNDNATVAADAENGTIYVAAALDNVASTTSRSINYGNDVYNASVTLNATETNLFSEDSMTSAEFSTEQLDEDLSMDVYNVTNADNQSITAESNAADGTEYNLLVESTETEGDGFIEPENAATVEDGELNFEVDFSDATVGDQFEATLEGLDGDYSADGNVVEDAGGEDPTTTADDSTTTADDTTTDEPTDTTTDEPTDTTADEDTTTAADDTTTSGDDGGSDGGDIPGFGVGIALVALLGAALLALRE